MTDIKLCQICKTQISKRNKYYCSRKCADIAKSEITTKKWQNNEYREMQLNARKDFWTNRSQKAKAKMSKSAKDRQNGERIKRNKHKIRSEISKKISKQLWQQESYRIIMNNKNMNGVKEKWLDKEYKNKMKQVSKNNMIKLWRNKDFANKSKLTTSNRLKKTMGR